MQIKIKKMHKISHTDLEQILDGSVWIVKAGSQCSDHLVSLESHGHYLHHHVLVLLAGDQHALSRHLARGLRARALCGSCGGTGGGGRGSLRFCLTKDGNTEHLCKSTKFKDSYHKDKCWNSSKNLRSTSISFIYALKIHTIILVSEQSLWCITMSSIMINLE